MAGGETAVPEWSNDGVPVLEKQLVRATLTRRLFGVELPPPRLARYQVLRRIGEGGMGLVVEARDPRTGEHVALKVLRGKGPAELHRLKREFRALSNLHHPSLVQLFELSLDGDEPCLAMELVSGSSLLAYVREAGILHVERLQACMRQLIDAVSTLHAAGVLHRDLKPSNLLVEPGGRLVVLDFGLAWPMDEDSAGGRAGFGTPLYMAPERLGGLPGGPSSDWYSVGVILGEALGIPAGIARAAPRLLETGTWPRLATAGTAELAALCRQLLDPDPERRPSGEELCARVGLEKAKAPLGILRTAASDRVFVGRDRELQRLREVFEEVRRGASCVVYLGGEPGIGKTALARHFVAELKAEQGVTVLAARCYERERIAFNAVDGLVDALAETITRLPEAERRGLQAHAIPELARLFPALTMALSGVVEPIDLAQADPQRVRQRAFDALRQMLAALGARQPLLIWLDDLQWGDADSARALTVLMQEPSPAPMLWIASYRSADAAHSSSLQALESCRPSGSRGVVTLELRRLGEAASLRLLDAVCAAHLTEAERHDLSREAEGSPLFLRVLAQQRGYPVDREVGVPVHWQRLLGGALGRLPRPSQQLVQLVALAGRPLEPGLLLEAAQRSAEQPHWLEHLSALQRMGLVRSVQGARGPAIESYHDRVRETVAELVPPAERRRYHLSLAEAAAAGTDPDPEFLSLQYEGAAELSRAAHHAEQAGDRAMQAVALERAAELYARGLQLGAPRTEPRLRKLADAIAYTGRCVEAAPLYLEAAAAVTGRDRLELQLRAAEMFLRSGRLDNCAQAIKPVLSAVRVRYPKSVHEARIGILVDQLRLRLRRTPLGEGRRRAPTELEQLRTDVCFTLGYRLCLADPPRAARLLVRSLLLSLEHGTDAQLARGLGCYALMLTTWDVGPKEAQDRLFEQALQLATSLPHEPETRGWVLFFRSLAHYARAQFGESLALCRDGQRWVGAYHTDSGYLLQELESVATAQLCMLGEVAELRAVVHAALRRAHETGNEFHIAVVRCHYGYCCLADDEAGRALAEADEVLRVWVPAGQIQMILIAMWLKVQALLYGDRPDEALQTLRKYLPIAARGGYLKVRPWRSLLQVLEANSALACARRWPGDRSFLPAVRSGIEGLRRRPSGFAVPMASMLEAGLAQLEGDPERAAQLYAVTARAAEAQGLSSCAAMARLRQAELLAPTEAHTLRASALAWCEAQGILRPDRWARLYAPIVTSA